MAATNNKIAYAASSAVTITLASLASDSTLLIGRSSILVDNSANLYFDYLLAGKITTGTSPTDGKEIDVYLVGMLDDTTWPDVFAGTDAAKTVTNSYVRDGGVLVPVASMLVTATSNVAYPFGPISVAGRFGGSCPRKWGFWVVQNTGVALNATGGNHVITITPVYSSSGN